MNVRWAPPRSSFIAAFEDSKAVAGDVVVIDGEAYAVGSRHSTARSNPAGDEVVVTTEHHLKVLPPSPESA